MRYLTVLTLLLAGCISKEYTPIRHYVVSPEFRVEPVSPDGKTLGYRPLEAALPYRLPMAYLEQHHELRFREHAQWADYPADILTRAIEDALKETGRFADVGDAGRMARPDYLLTGIVRRFEEDRTVDPPAAVAEVRLELREARGTEVVWEGLLREQEPVGTDDAGAVAAAMSRAVARIASEAAASIAAASIAGAM